MTYDSSIAPQVEEIKRALEDRLSEEEIAQELQRYFDFGVDAEEAKRGIIKKYGGNVTPFQAPAVRKKLSELSGSEPNVMVKGKVFDMKPKAVTVRGEERTIQEGLIGDETAVLGLTAWIDTEIADGDLVEIKGAYTKTFRGDVQINLGNRTTINRLEPDEDFKVADYTPEGPREAKINELSHGMSQLTVTGKIIDVEEREVTARDEQKTVWSGSLADDTGKVSFSAWKDFDLKVGEVVKITGAYVKSWRSIPQLSFDDRAEVERVEGSELSDLDAGKASLMTLEDLIRLGGAFDVNVEAVVIDIKDTSGLIQRCPECNRVITDGACINHGPVEGVPDMRVKGVLDDGSGAVTLVLNSEATQSILGMNLEEAHELARSDLQSDAVILELQKKLLGRPLRVRGNVTTDDFGVMMIGTEAETMAPDVKTIASGLLESLGVE